MSICYVCCCPRPGPRFDFDQAEGALRELHAVCVAMDGENEGERPTEEVYQAAMSRAAAALDVGGNDGR